MAAEFSAISYDQLFTSEDDSCFLGQGSFSQVYRCYHTARGDLAVKIFDTNMRNPITSFNKEGKLHMKANPHAHILTLHGLSQKQPGFVGLVLEYMPYGSLADLIFNHGIEPPWTFRLQVLSEIASAISYLHNLTEQKRLIHCDLKAENILLSSDLHAKIADFGGATLSSYTGATFASSTRGTRETNNELVQYTLSYAAPELLGQLDAKRTPQMDTYSFAIITYVTTARCVPYYGVQEQVMENAVKGGQRPSRNLKEVKEDLQENNDLIGIQVFKLFDHLMQKCWEHDPKQRLKMLQVRDSMSAKLKSLPPAKVAEDILKLKQQMLPGGTGLPTNAVNVYQKYLILRRANQIGPQQRTNQLQSYPYLASVGHEVPVRLDQSPRAVVSPHVSQQPVSPRQVSYPSPPPRSHQPSPPQNLPLQRTQQESSTMSTFPKEMGAALPDPGNSQGARRKEYPQRIESPLSPTRTGIRELEASFSDPYLRQGSVVRMITDVAAIKNAQVGHGGWMDYLTQLRDMEGTVKKVEDNGDVTVDFSGVRSHRFNPNSLVKVTPDKDLHVGDFVVVTLDKDLVKMMQEEHGGWVDEMEQFFNQPGLIFRFLPDRDVLVVYKNGMYFRFNPDVLYKTSAADHLLDLCLHDNPNIKIGDYVCHDLEDEVIKHLQDHCGGWNSVMSELRGRVGKFVYADYHGRAFVAYSSKLCFVFNPAALTRLKKEEASRLFQNNKEEAKRLVQMRVDEQSRYHRFAVDDIVRVCLPLDIVIELQRGHGGWCYQMLEVYGLTGQVKAFDEGGNAQVLFDTGNKWTFNPTSLEKIPPGPITPAPSYVPPFKIGDKVRVRIKDLNNASLNKMRQAFKMLDIPEEKVEILMKSGEVLGIDDDIDVIVSFGDGKNYGLKPEQLQKL